MIPSLYLHYPFCNNICTYCDYCKTQYIKSLEESYFDALKKEIELIQIKQPQINNFKTLYIGGGTPSMANQKLLSDLIEKLKMQFSFQNDFEFSIECNPEDITSEKLNFFDSIGLNRIILGVQTFHKQSLKLLGRNHSQHDINKAIYLCNVYKIKNIAADFLFGLPSQTGKQFSSDLDELINLNPSHISHYQLTIEPDTALYKKSKSKRLYLPDDDLLFGIYKSGVERLKEFNYDRYEISSFAKESYQCQHNLNYWQGGDYIGLGVGAHSFYKNHRYLNNSNLYDYLQSIKENKLPIINEESDLLLIAKDFLSSSLRTIAGINRQQFEDRFVTLDKLFDKQQYDLFIESGHLIPDKGDLYLSDDGLNQADEIIRRLLV